MTFTYTGDPSVSTRDKVRFLIGDTISAEKHFEDEEIQYLVTEWGEVYSAARAAAEILAGRYAHKAQSSKSVGDLSISESYSSASAEFRLLAVSIEAQRTRKGGAQNPRARINLNSIKSTGNRTALNPTTDFIVGGMDNLKGANPNYLDGQTR